MKVQVFIPDWNHPTCKVNRVVNDFKEAGAETTVLDAYDVPFAQQWSEAVFRFTGDIFFYAMADVTPPLNTKKMVEEMTAVFELYNVGAYTPKIKGSGFTYSEKRLRLTGREFEPDMYRVPANSMLFIGIRKELLEALPPLGDNIRGWYLDYVLSAYAKKAGQFVAYDAAHEAVHPYQSNYPTGDALERAQAWLRTLPLDIQTVTETLIGEVATLS